MKIDNEIVYTRVVNEYADMLYRITFQNLWQDADVQDVLQDVFVKLLKNRKKEFQDEEHLKAWLIRTTINQSIDYKRRWIRRKEDSITENQSSMSSVNLELKEALMSLSKEERSIVYLFYFEGFSLREIADIMGMKQNTVSSKLRRSRLKLKDYMEEESYDYVSGRNEQVKA